MLVPKGFLRLQGVGRNTEYGGLACRKCVSQSREVDGLLGAARGVGAGIEEKYQFSSRIVGERDGFAAIAGKTEGGSHCTLGQLRSPIDRRVGFSARRFGSNCGSC